VKAPSASVISIPFPTPASDVLLALILTAGAERPGRSRISESKANLRRVRPSGRVRFARRMEHVAVSRSWVRDNLVVQSAPPRGRAGPWWSISRTFRPAKQSEFQIERGRGTSRCGALTNTEPRSSLTFHAIQTVRGSVNTSISIVMATYNGAAYIGEQLRSFASQTLLPAELVVSDDDSTDATLDIVRDFAQTSPFSVRILRNKTRLGYANNFLNAAQAATSELLAFSDQDDIWYAEKLSAGAAPFRDPEVVLSSHAVDLVDKDLRPLGIHGASQQALTLISPLQGDPWGFYSGFTMMLRRSLLSLIPSSARGQDPLERTAPLAHDRWVYFLAWCAGDTAVIGRPLAAYRQHGTNLYGAGRESLFARTSKALRNHSDLPARAGHRRIIAQNRESLLLGALESPAAKADQSVQRKLQAAYEYWRLLERTEERRHSLYCTAEMLRRLWHLLENARSGTYSPRMHGNAYRAAIARDALSVFLQP
jgi:hypothetical protein